MHRLRSVQFSTLFFLTLWLGWGITLAAIRIARPGLEIGADWNDAHILVASDWFAVHGYRGTLAIPPRQTAPNPEGSYNLYNTFPPGVFWLHELRRAVGIEALWAHRLAVIVWNHLAVLVFFVFVRRVTASAAIAAAAGSLYMFSAPYATYSGGLWEHLPMLTLLGTLACWWEYEQSVRPAARRTWLAAACACFAVENLLSVQHTVMIGLLGAWRAIAIMIRANRAKPGVGWRNWCHPLVAAGVVLCAAPLVLFTRFAMQARVMGGWHAAINYFAGKASERMGVTDETDSGVWVWRLLASRFGVLGLTPFDESRKLQGCYPALNVLVVGGTAVLLWQLWRRRSELGFRPVHIGLAAGAAMTAAALSWPIMFPQHTVIHAPATLMFLPGLSLMLGSMMIVPGCAAQWRSRTLAWIATIAIAAPMLSSLRLSESLNCVVPLNDGVAEEVADRAARWREVRSVADHFAGARMAYTMPNPVTAHALRLPFAKIPFDPPPTVIDPDALMAIRTDRRDGRRAMALLATSLGLPRMLAAPGSLACYGYGAADPPGSARSRVRMPITGEMVIAETLLSPSIDGRVWIGMVRIDCRGINKFLQSGPRLRLTTFGQDGAEQLHIDVAVDERKARGDGVLLTWCEAPIEAMRGWTRADLSVGTPGHMSQPIVLTPGERPATLVTPIRAATPR